LEARELLLSETLQHQTEFDTFTPLGVGALRAVKKLQGRLARRDRAGDEALARSLNKLTTAVRRTNAELSNLLAAVERI
jgi:hypothetical protein